ELITVQLTEEDKVEDDVVFYLVFTGSTVQHCTSTRKINPGSLETISPGHDCCETVKVVLCASKEGHPILVVAEESFQFIQDEAYDAAQFLATCAGNQQALIFTRFLDRSRPPAADVDFLDEKVALAFRHLKLPAEWNVLGADQSLNENIPRETLMHFAVRLGLLRLTWFLLQQPGGRGALSIHNNEGATPVSLALERGYQKLHQLLTEEEAREPDSWSTLSHTVHAGEYCVKHHRRLDVYLLTAETKEGTKASLESDIRQLQLHMQSGHPTTSSQSLEEMAGEGREENPSDVIHLNSGQLSDQAHQEDKSPNGSLGAVSDGPNGLLSLGDAESPACSCESKNTVTLGEKEEEGPGSAEGSGAVSDENGCTASPHAGVNGAVNLPSCGNTDEEAGMTSAGVVLDQAGLCSKDSTHQEAPAAEERAAESAVPGLQTAGEAPASPTGTDKYSFWHIVMVCLVMREKKKKVTFEVFITGTKLRHNHIPAGQCRIKSQKRLTEDSKSGLSLICYFCFFQINRESWCSLEPCPDSSLLEQCENFLEDGLSSVCASSQGVLKRESGSESDLFPLPGDGMEDLVFGKQPEEEQSACDVTSSSSSADDTISLERNSSLGSDTSLPFPPAVSFMQPKDRRSLDGSCTSMAAPEGGEGEPAGLGEKDEELDSITDVPTPSSVLRNSMRPLSPFRRHSWGPGKNATNEAEINQRSSMRVLGDGIKKPPIHRRSYSLEGLAGDAGESKKPSANLEAASLSSKDLRRSPLASNQCGSLVLLTEELEQGEIRDYDRQMHPTSQPQGFNFCTSSVSSPLTKSVSLMSISKPALDSEIDLCKVTRHSFIFSWQEKEKDKEKTKEKDKDSKEKEKDKKLLNGHLFTATSVVAQATCYHCMKPFNKDSYYCANCNAIVHKGCKESFASCAKVKMKPQKGMLQAHDTSSLPTVTMRNKSSQPKERPRSAILAPDENTVTSIFNNRRSQQTTALSKSVSIQNIAGVGNDDSLIHTWKFLSQSTDSLHKISRVNESMESLVDEGADMNEGQLMGDLELDSKLLEAESWSQVVDSKFLQQQNKDVVKRQDVIYELMQTEMHHVRTLKIMNDVYSAGMLKELQYDQQIVDKIFPCLENLLHIHSHFFQRILERKKESLADKSEKNFVIKRIGDILVNQFSGENAERMKKTYGKFCGHHNEAVNNFKDLYSKDKRFQAFVKKKMSSSLVRRLGISECILLVTQRITKYPVLLQRILQYTKENEVEHEDLTQSLNLVKDVIAAVNSKVSNYEKKTRLDEIYNRTDSKSIMRMKSGQMFAREDLRHRKLIRDGPVSLKNAAGRLKEVQAVLLSDMLIFLQEKDQKYVFASLDQKSTVISLKKLIVREVAHEEKGLFLISMGVKDPEMVEVHASSKEERNGWKEIIQDTIYTMDKDEDEGVPCESEFEKKVSDTRVRALKEQLHQKDKQILVLLEEKTKIFRDMADTSAQEDMPGSRLLFRANTEEAPKGEAIMKTAINEVELLQDLVNRSLGCALGQQVSTTIDQEGVGPISLPRRAETFGGFDSHQMNASKCGVKDEGDDAQDLRRTESDSILKKVSLDLSGVVLQQDTYIEDQKLALSERALTRSFFRPTSLLEQEKQRNLEKQRQEFANLKKQQAQHQEEKRRKEKEWEARENQLTEQEAQLAQREEQVQRGWQDLEREREELQVKKAAYQLDLERLRTAQKQLERDKAQLKRDMERLPQTWLETDHNQVSNTHEKLARVSSQSSIEDFSKQKSPSLPKQGHFDAELSVSPKRNSLSRTHKEKSTFHLLSTTNQTNKAAEEQPQMPTRLFSLSKPKEKKDKKKKGRGHRSQQSDSHSSEAPPEGEEIFC
uniref:A-kinase anchoring protein 13 n=1 Tax=Anas platyrhynchos TaxID=8839 RepID=A0A8B9R587_ANAPL